MMENLFSNSRISIAGHTDIATITHLLNSAYRGESSKAGWTTEANLIAGNTRTDEHNLAEIMELPNSIFLKYTDEKGSLIGCVNLQHNGDRIYLGMLSVSPLLQGSGIGKHLLKAADEYARLLHCRAVYMTVITARIELIDWYKRYGYHDTGERIPFIEDGLTGKHLQPLEFMVLEKMIL